MLKIRIIPVLLWNGVSLVKGIKFNSWRRIGVPLPAVKVYNLRQVDELIMLDIAATSENRRPDCGLIAELSSDCFVPLTVGGGIRSLGDVQAVLSAGADKICLNSAAFEHPQLLKEISAKFGSQCLVVSIDAHRTNDGSYECFSHSGNRATKREPGEWARYVESLGAGEILITSIDHDGLMQGYDLDLIRGVTGAVNIPVIACGGAGDYVHMYEAITKGKAQALAAASMFHFTHKTPQGAKQFLWQQGLAMRMDNCYERNHVATG